MDPRIRILAILTIGFLILQSASLFSTMVTNVKQPKTGTVLSAQTDQQYTIKLIEHGLPPGMLWYSYIGPANGSYYGGKAKTSIGSTITYYEYAGSYSFSLGANGPYLAEQGNIYVTITDYPVTVNITFVEQFNVSVNEKGLPQGFPWGFTLKDITNKSNNGGVSTPPFRETLSEFVSNGTYSLNAGTYLDPVDSILGMVSNITVNGSPVNINLTFYRVNITREDLKNGTEWGIPYSYATGYPNGTTINYSGYHPGKNSSLILYLPNASYSIHPVALDYYSPTMNFVLNGKGLNLSEMFQRGYNVTFVEEGKAATLGLPWMVGGFPVIYDETPYAMTAFVAETFQVPNGTFDFNASVSGDYVTINKTLYEVQGTLENSNTTFAVQGNNTTIYLNFNLTLYKQPGNSSGGILSNSALYYLLTLVAIVITAAAVLLYYTKRGGGRQ